MKRQPVQHKDISVQRKKAQSERFDARPHGHHTLQPYRGLLIFVVVCGLVFVFGVSAAPAQPGGGFKKTAKKEKKKKPAPPAVKVKRLPSMDIVRPMLTKTEHKELTDELIKAKFGRVLTSGVDNPNNRKVIAKWARLRILSMTMKENLGKTFEMKKIVRDEISKAGVSLRENPVARQNFRRIVCKAVADQCIKVLDNNYYVRLQAVLILSNLDQLKLIPTPRPPKLPVAYAEACVPLLEVIGNAKQPLTIKIPAVNGLKRIARLAKFDLKRNRKIANGLLAEFKKTDTHWWYQSRLAEALAAVELRIAKAPIVHALAEAVVDTLKHRKPRTRCAAAKALGRAVLPSGTNLDLLIFEIVKLTKEMADQYNADVDLVEAKKKKRVSAHWSGSFWNIYLAFQLDNRLEELILKNRFNPIDQKAGFLLKFPKSGVVISAYKEILPIAGHVLEQFSPTRKAKTAARIPADDIADLKEWLGSHRPKSFRVQSGFPPLEVMKAALAKQKKINGVGGP